MCENPGLFFKAKWFCPDGLKDIAGIEAEYADPAGYLPCGITLQAISAPDWQLRIAIFPCHFLVTPTMTAGMAISQFMAAL